MPNTLANFCLWVVAATRPLKECRRAEDRLVVLSAARGDDVDEEEMGVVVESLAAAAI